MDMDLLGIQKLNQCMFGDNGAAINETVGQTIWCDDISTIGKAEGFGIVTAPEGSILGRKIAEEFRRRFEGKEPETNGKNVNGSIRPVNTYRIEHDVWIRELIRVEIVKIREPKTAKSSKVPTTATKPFNPMHKYFKIST